MWHFDGPTGFPRADLKTVVPNGLVKLIIPYAGTLRSERESALLRLCPSAEIAVVGLQDRPVVIDSPGAVAVIGVELRADAAYRLLGIRLCELTNQVVLADDLEILTGARAGLRDRLEQAKTVPERVQAVEDFLLALLAAGRSPKPVVSWAVNLIAQRRGGIRVDELCRRLGYSRRYLDLCFEEQVGVGPKTLAAILRFQHAFRAIRAGAPGGALTHAALEPYADQSHFIREFRRFAGRAPMAYLRARNEFGDLFYGT
jgi:methylphosphotriester-DNA--protein-cysteine methyltransferase